jgi:hypothetical protein
MRRWARPGHPTKPFYSRDEIGLKPRSDRLEAIKQEDSIMLGILINLLYRQSCRAALSAIRMQTRISA